MITAIDTPVLSLTDVTLTYPDGENRVTVLDGVSLQVAPGTMTAVTGESGCGKSTLLSVAAGLAVPDSGTVTVAGDDLSPGRADGAVRTRVRRESIGMVFQSPNLLASLRVREQLLIADHIRNQRPGRITRAIRPTKARADDLLDRVGLAGLGDRRVSELSGGQRQRVNIARALTGSPQLLLADEPTSALDADRSRQIVRLLRELTDDLGLASVLVTHDRSHLDLVDDVLTLG
jgi:putative ABC transport system ATP-binding protein